MKEINQTSVRIPRLPPSVFQEPPPPPLGRSGKGTLQSAHLHLLGNLTVPRRLAQFQ